MQLMMDKRKFFNPSLNVNVPKMKIGLPVKLGIGTVSFIAGFACGYITAVDQQDLIKNVVQKAVEDSQVIKKEVHKGLEKHKVEFIKNVVLKSLEEYKVELIESVTEKMLEKNKAMKKNELEKKRN